MISNRIDKPRQLRQLAPLDLPMVPFVVAGMACWAVAGLVLLAFRDSLVEHDWESWLRICLAGLLLGIPGLALMIKYDHNRSQRRSPPATSPADETLRVPR